jgi:4,5:9,10-diseco-3-hydroxy-5,9,17-trioxoandrosta-1(10),2-diene-4-oate hydrolase
LTSIREGIIRRKGLNVTEKWVHSGDIRTFYLDAGTGPPVILLHGGGGGGVFWAPIINKMSDRFRVIVPDIVGYGESDKPLAGYDKTFFVKWLLDFCDAINVQQTDLIANSQGGCIALQFAMDYGKRLSKLILVSTAGIRWPWLSLHMLVAMCRLNCFPSMKAVRNMTKMLIHRPDRFPDDHELAYFLAVIQSKGGDRVFKQGRGKIIQPFHAAELAQIDHPTLFIWGEKDRIFSRKHGEKGIRILPNARMEIISEAGHAPFIDRPDRFCAIAIQFLSAKRNHGR